MAGVGGKTIHEAKQNLSYTEAQDWAAYIAKRGPLNLSRHLERGFAMLAVRLAAANGVNVSMQSFMPYTDIDDDDQAEIQLEDAIERWC